MTYPMKKTDLQCQQCGQTWRWPSDMERAGLCVNCAAHLCYAENQRSGFIERLTDPTVCMNADKAGGQHVWDGPSVDNGVYCSVSCSRCGVLAIDVDARLGL
jgi:hypothetical protein